MSKPLYAGSSQQSKKRHRKTLSPPDNILKRILSAFYGVLKPMDGVTPYRLEMQANVEIGYAKNLYEYWHDMLYRSVIDESRIIINLASKEYSKCIWQS